MASGNKEMVINTLERSVSNDYNRGWAFGAAHTSEALRWLLASIADENGAQLVGSTTGTPMFAVFLGGLWARPEIGTVNLFVEPGMVGLVNPDGSPSPDDSLFKVVTSPGIQTAGQLTLTAGGGGTRIDVIEFRRNASVINETSSRDVYDPSSGLFVAALVTKVKADELEFRIRTGTPGAGYPGAALGWTPIAIAQVPSSAVTWNDCIVWDVRRLASDFVRSPSLVRQTFPLLGKQFATAVELGIGDRKLRGIIETELNYYRVGGELANLTSGASYLDLVSTEVVESGFSVSNNLPWYLYLATPFGLPRWARYTDFSSGVRAPGYLKGIPIFSQTAPGTMRMLPGTPLNFPSAIELGGTTSEAVVAMTGAFASAGSWLDSLLADGWTHFGSDGSGIALSPASGAGTANVVYELEDNVTHPVGASVVKLRFRTNINMGGATDVTMIRAVTINDTAPAAMMQVGVTRTATRWNNALDVFEVDIPLTAIGGMPTGAPQTRTIALDYTLSGSPAFSLQSAHVVGWRLGM